MKVMLKEVRNSRGLSQNQLARAIDMTPQYIQKIEYGKIKSVPLDTLSKLCRVLNCQTGDILVYMPDGDEFQVSNEEEKPPKLKQSSGSAYDHPSHSYRLTRSFLAVVQGIPESA